MSEDRPIPQDAEIAAAHPTETKRHGIYANAHAMVSAKHSKGALVDMVNWLLCKVDDLKNENAVLRDQLKDATAAIVRQASK